MGCGRSAGGLERLSGSRGGEGSLSKGLSLLLGPPALLISIVVRLVGRASPAARGRAMWLAGLGWCGVISFVVSSWYAVYNGERLF